MIPGPYSICRTDPTDDSEGTTFESLKWGYHSVAQATADLVAIAEDYGEDESNLLVIRLIDPALYSWSAA